MEARIIIMMISWPSKRDFKIIDGGLRFFPKCYQVILSCASSDLSCHIALTIIVQMSPSQELVRWREAEAVDLFRHNLDTETITLLCRFHPFSDNGDAWKELQKRQRTVSNCFLDTFGIDLNQAKFKDFWGWTASQVWSDTDPEKISVIIDRESTAHFRNIPFESWVRHSLGFDEPPIRQLYAAHARIGEALRTFVHYNPETREKYVSVAEVAIWSRSSSSPDWNCPQKLHNRNPFAYRAIYDGLVGKHSISFDYWIATPIRKLFEQRQTPLAVILRRLALLSIRFNILREKGDLDLDVQFDISTALFDSFITASPDQLALELTIQDLLNLIVLKPLDFVAYRSTPNNDNLISRIQHQGNALSIAPWEFIIMHPKNALFIYQTAAVSQTRPM